MICRRFHEIIIICRFKDITKYLKLWITLLIMEKNKHPIIPIPYCHMNSFNNKQIFSFSFDYNKFAFCTHFSEDKTNWVPSLKSLLITRIYYIAIHTACLAVSNIQLMNNICSICIFRIILSCKLSALARNSLLTQKEIDYY